MFGRIFYGEPASTSPENALKSRPHLAYDAASPPSLTKANEGGWNVDVDGTGNSIAAAIALAAIWLVVLLGSRYFGPQ